MTDTIICSRCKKEKSLDAFTRSKSGKHGRNHMCRVCLAEVQAQYQRTMREHNLAHGPTMEGTRRCTNCKQTKHITEFPVVLTRKGGRGGRCLKCTAEKQASIREKNRERMQKDGPVMTGTKKCANCERVKPVTEFPTNASTGDGRRRLCRDCYRSEQHMLYLARKKAAGA